MSVLNSSLVIRWKIKTSQDLQEVAEWMLQKLEGADICCLNGEMGSGKTTFVKIFGRLINILSPIVSPTYNIIHHYKGGEKSMAHIDLYRLKTVREAVEVGCLSACDESDITFIEWPKLVKQLLPMPIWWFSILCEDNEVRIWSIYRVGELY